MSWEGPDPRRDEDESLEEIWPDPERREWALERLLLAVHGVREQNSRRRRLVAYFARRRSTGYSR